MKSSGADVAGHNAATMDRSQHDELAQLFAQRMHLSQQAQQGAQTQPQQQAQQDSEVIQHVSSIPEKQQQQPHDSPTVAYISSHYTGTAHIRPPDVTSEPSRSPPPPYNEYMMPEAMADTLRQHSIEPTALLPNQVHLFLNADYEQRCRLLELWRIAPPSYPLDDYLNGTWVTTSVQREEDLARARYERRQQEGMPGEEHMLDTHIAEDVEPMSPIREVGEPAWPPAARMRAASIAASKRHSTAEEYIVNGYAADRTSKSMDPVYAAAAGLWQAPSYAEAVEQQRRVEQQRMMEDQYGMLEQIRNHADWERMNEQVARQTMASAYDSHREDDDMEL